MTNNTLVSATLVTSRDFATAKLFSRLPSRRGFADSVIIYRTRRQCGLECAIVTFETIVAEFRGSLPFLGVVVPSFCSRNYDLRTERISTLSRIILYSNMGFLSRRVTGSLIDHGGSDVQSDSTETFYRMLEYIKV